MKGDDIMSYSIKEVAEMMGVAPSTLRYYDKEGLLPGIRRVNGIRVFEDEDFKWLRVLNCLKNTNMPIRKIKKYVDLAALGDESLQERYELILEQRQKILDDISLLEGYLKQVEFKKWYYEEAIRAGSEDAVREYPSNEPSLEADKIPENNREDR